MPYTDCLFVVLVSFCSALAAEGFSYLLIYRRNDYKNLKKNIEHLQKKLDKKKEELVTFVKQKTRDKKMAQMDENLKARQRDMAVMNFKSTFVVMFAMLGVLGLLNNMFDGHPVAKLPFIPIPLLRGMSHRNLPGDDFTECSMIFMYVLCSFSIRQNVQKFLGFAPPKGSALFQPPEMPEQKSY